MRIATLALLSGFLMTNLVMLDQAFATQVRSVHLDSSNESLAFNRSNERSYRGSGRRAILAMAPVAPTSPLD